MEKHTLQHFLPAIKAALVIFLFLVGLSLIPGAGRWIGKAAIGEAPADDGKIARAVAKEHVPPASTTSVAAPGKSADRKQSELKGPAIPPEELDKWLAMPKSGWLPLLEERTASLPEATRQELLSLMDHCQGLAKNGLGHTHPTFKESRDLIVRKSYSRFGGSPE